MSTPIYLEKFEEVYQETYASILKYIVCKCSRLEDVNDILQDTYVEFYKLLERKKKLELQSVNAFLIGIAKKRLKKYYGILYQTATISISEEKDGIKIEDTLKDDMNLEDVVLARQDFDQVWEFLRGKEVVIGKVFYLYYCTNMSIKEISDELKIKESSVKNYLYRTRKELNRVFRRESE